MGCARSCTDGFAAAGKELGPTNRPTKDTSQCLLVTTNSRNGHYRLPAPLGISGKQRLLDDSLTSRSPIKLQRASRHLQRLIAGRHHQIASRHWPTIQMESARTQKALDTLPIHCYCQLKVSPPPPLTTNLVTLTINLPAVFSS